MCQQVITKPFQNWRIWLFYWNRWVMICKKEVQCKANLSITIDFPWRVPWNEAYCLLYAVPDRTTETLLSCIKECILTGTIIMSDLWKSYRNSQYQMYWKSNTNILHLITVKTFLTLLYVGLTHPQTIESLGASTKPRNKRECGTNRYLLHSYLFEFMSHQRKKD